MLHWFWSHRQMQKNSARVRVRDNGNFRHVSGELTNANILAPIWHSEWSTGPMTFANIRHPSGPVIVG